MIRALSLYLDRSVIGGYFDAEFLADTRALWRLMEAGRSRFVASQVVIDEIAGAPPQACAQVARAIGRISREMRPIATSASAA